LLTKSKYYIFLIILVLFLNNYILSYNHIAIANVENDENNDENNDNDNGDNNKDDNDHDDKREKKEKENNEENEHEDDVPFILPLPFP